jgi:hypothetical protein
MTPHTCPTCASALHTNGALEAWITPDGRVILLTASAKIADHRWLELPASAQNWLAEILHQAHQTARERPRA